VHDEPLESQAKIIKTFIRGATKRSEYIQRLANVLVFFFRIT